MSETLCAVCGQAVGDDAIRGGVCPHCGDDPLALPPGSPPDRAWLFSRLMFVVAILIFAIVLWNSALLGFAVFVLAIVLAQFWSKRIRYKRATTPPPTPADDETPPAAPSDTL